MFFKIQQQGYLLSSVLPCKMASLIKCCVFKIIFGLRKICVNQSRALEKQGNQRWEQITTPERWHTCYPLSSDCRLRMQPDTEMVCSKGETDLCICSYNIGIASVPNLSSFHPRRLDESLLDVCHHCLVSSVKQPILRSQGSRRCWSAYILEASGWDSVQVWSWLAFLCLPRAIPR